MKKYLILMLVPLYVFAYEISLTKTQATMIANKIWQNEGAGLDKYLIHWNEGEDFASLGIGHFIWFSKGHTERFREVFPMVIKYMEQKGVEMPEWLNSHTSLPWNSKEEFYSAKNGKSKKYMELFNFLKSTFPYQAEFMAKRLEEALPQILNSIEDSEKKEIIKKRFYDVMTNDNGTINENGLYILVDYTNFKGEGTLKSERYNGKGWGLLQVLWNLDESQDNIHKAFAMSASRMLDRRIENSPKARGEVRWRRGWNIRLKTYWK